MSRQLRLCWFHVKQYCSVGYFVQLLIMTTLTLTILQYLGLSAFGAEFPDQIWLRTGIIGMWTSAATSAGILGFEKHKGTLIYLTLSVIHPLKSIAALVSASSLFGLLSFPLAWIEWAIIAQISPLAIQPLVPSLSQLLGITFLWIGCTTVSCALANLFLLTPNALAYEGLLIVPVLALSGVFFSLPGITHVTAFLNPLSAPIQFIYGSKIMSFHALLAGYSCSLVLWCLIALFLGNYALKKARIDGTLELV